MLCLTHHCCCKLVEMNNLPEQWQENYSAAPQKKSKTKRGKRHTASCCIGQPRDELSAAVQLKQTNFVYSFSVFFKTMPSTSTTFGLWSIFVESFGTRTIAPWSRRAARHLADCWLKIRDALQRDVLLKQMCITSRLTHD